jgi:hypothetical protein
MTIEEAEAKLSNMNFDSIVKSYCNKVNYIEKLKEELNELKGKLNQPIVNDIREALIAYELKLWIQPTKEQIEIAEKIVDIYLKIKFSK